MSSNEDLETRLSFLGIDAAARNHLKTASAQIDKYLSSALDGFYTHIAKFGDVDRLFSSQDVKDHAKSAQRRHWGLIAAAEFDGQYVDSVRRIGHAHHQLGLEPRWYLGGYAYILADVVTACAEELHETHPGAEMADTRKETLAALIKAAFLDMDFAISIYLDEGKKEKAEALETMVATFEETVGGFARSLAKSVKELQDASGAMSQTANVTSEKSANVAAAAEQATSNVSTIASAVEEMTQSIKEISGQVHNAAQVTRRVADRATDTNTTVKGLVEASEKIGAVVGLIKDVADQTNLLALNATIEAARAGEAGRGFAVVASEVKTLANQTASATEEIRELVVEMQKVTSASAAALGDISTEISEVDTLSALIASAVEEQSAATNEIARNTQEASTGTRIVSESICEVQNSTQETGSVAEQVRTAASALAEQSEALEQQVSAFLDKVRAA